MTKEVNEDNDDYDDFIAANEWDGLNPMLRAFAEVGRFMHSWNMVEQQIDDAISTALSLNALQRAVLSANLALSNKMSVVTTLLALTPMDTDQKEALRRKIDKFHKKWIPRRNIIAHNGFWLTKDKKAVRFFHVRA